MIISAVPIHHTGEHAWRQTDRQTGEQTRWETGIRCCWEGQYLLTESCKLITRYRHIHTSCVNRWCIQRLTHVNHPQSTRHWD